MAHQSFFPCTCHIVPVKIDCSDSEVKFSTESWRFMTRPDGNNLKHYLGLILLCLVLYLPGLTTLPPVDRDEARWQR
jgi:hypothetical protein